jgi:hypothetical protein
MKTWWVSVMKRSLFATLPGIAIVWTATVAAAEAADLSAATSAAFDRYAHLTESRLDGEVVGASPFLWVDRLPDPAGREAVASLRRGEIIVHRMDPIEISGGLGHHWVGTVFVPSTTLDRTAALMQAYDRYHDIYHPAVRRSRLIGRDGPRFRVLLQLFMKKAISVVVNASFDVQYIRISPTRMQVRSTATRIAEVENPDTLEEREKPVGQDNGFLWRFNNYCALEQRDGGTIVQCESVSLSRSIPTGLGWLIGPFVTSIPRESLEFTLRSLRGALLSGRGQFKKLLSNQAARCLGPGRPPDDLSSQFSDTTRPGPNPAQAPPRHVGRSVNGLNTFKPGLRKSASLPVAIVRP